MVSAERAPVSASKARGGAALLRSLEYKAINTPPQIVPKEPPKLSSNGSDPEKRPPAKSREPMSEEEFHFLISELRDENSRSRMREAVWISIIFHLILLFVLKESRRIWPQPAVTLLTPAEQIQNQQLTYLDQKPDTQRAPKVQTNKLSDKDRVAMARNPKLKRLLDELADNRKSGAPKQEAAQQQAQAMPQGVPQQGPPQQQPPQQNQQQFTQQQPPPRQTQQQPNPFATYRNGSASSAIENATRAAAAGHGTGGDYGNGFSDPNTNNQGALDILSDTQGVDFGPYLQRVVHDVKMNWYSIIPEEAKWPLFKQGNLAIDFVITKDGKVAGMTLRLPSGDVALDRAAWGGITASNPFPPLPKEFTGENLALRFHFYYNPKRGSELR
jgi:TonB family protein